MAVIMTTLFPDEEIKDKPTRRKHGGRITLIILLVLLVAGGGYWLANFLMTYRPLINSIPLVQPGGQVTIIGARFGKQAVSANLVKADGSAVPLKVVAWTPEQIVVKLPDQTSGGAIAGEYHPAAPAGMEWLP